jgi:hypothetical protein
MTKISYIFIKELGYNFIILNFIYSFKDFKNIRTVNKDFYDSCMEVWEKYKVKEYISSPRGTMVNVSCCHICSNYIKDKKRIELLVNYYQYPEPVYIICENWKCIHDCLTDFFINAWESERVFLNKKNLLPCKNLIPRSNNEKTIANLDYNYMIIGTTGKLLVRSSWFEKGGQYTKDVEIKHIIKDKKPVISSWYKNCTQLQLKDIHNKIDNYYKS